MPDSGSAVTHARCNPAAARHAREPAAATGRRSVTASSRPFSSSRSAADRPAGRRPVVSGRLVVPRPAASPLRYPAAFTLIATGAILLCAVSLNTRYLDLNIVGLILLATGLAWLRVPQRAWRWARAHSDELRSALEQVTAVPEADAQRVPLDSLLHPVASQDPGTGQAWPPGDDYW
jgi:Flp pilus assembly protein TadB